MITRLEKRFNMLNYIWFGLIFISVVVGTITGRIDQVTEAAISMSKIAVEIAIGLIDNAVRK